MMLKDIPILADIHFVDFLTAVDEMIQTLNLDYSQLENMEIKS